MVTPEKFELAKATIRNRLRPLCGHMTDSDFEQMVEKIALNELKPSSNAWRVPES